MVKPTNWWEVPRPDPSGAGRILDEIYYGRAVVEFLKEKKGSH